jgi:hypothetical protein
MQTNILSIIGDSVNTNSTIAKRIQSPITFMLMLMLALSCSRRDVPQANSADERKRFVSLEYNHFEEGALFSDVHAGLTILWEASFRNGNNAFKENLAFFLDDGLLILPNNRNTLTSASLTTLRNYVENGKMYVVFKDVPKEVLGIIHTHPDVYSLHMPSPKNDYQFCYMGIHNYIMDNLFLFDAYKDTRGNEVFDILGSRNDYAKIPFVNKSEVTALSVLAKKSNNEVTITKR